MGARFTAEDIIYATNGRMLQGVSQSHRGRIVCSLKNLQPGDWFAAVTSGDYDGHDHIDEACRLGAAGCIVERRGRYPFANRESAMIQVTNMDASLLELARLWRFRVRPTVVGVGGAPGRRATMVILHELTKEHRKTHLTFMSEFGFRGAALDVLSMPDDTEILVFEAGAVERGCVGRLASALDTDIAILTSIKHPIDSQRDDHLAAMYLELIDSISDTKTQAKAIVYDANECVKNRLKQLALKASTLRRSECLSSLSDRVEQSQISALSDAMASSIRQSVSAMELWCAVEGALACGIPRAAVEQSLGVCVPV